ncbi:MAG: BMP family ABC transporter substrate-binding protein [Actinobacteria bacterium]|nr:BMP family ABC transporter substrate-binding protein [Actinomycetota bacterium]
MRRLTIGMAAAVACLGFVVAGCGGSSGSSDSTNTASTGGSSKQAMTVAVMTPASFADDGYAQFNLEALEAAIKNVEPGSFKVQKVENVPYTDQLTQTAQQLFAQGANVVLDANAAGELFYEACKEASGKACFEEYGPIGVPVPENTINFAYEESALYYLEGVAGGMLTKTGTLGFISSFKLAASTTNLNAFALGCQSVKPGCTVRNVYINSFNDPPKAVEAAKTLISAGADVISHDLDEPSGIKTAAAEGAWVFGTYQNQASIIGNKWVSGTNYTPSATAVLTAQLKAVREGTFKRVATRMYGPGKGIDSELQPWGEAVPTEVKEKVDALYKKMQAGWSPFQGPITDVNGKVRVPAGKSLDPRGDFVYQGWNWFVKGVIGG